MSDPLPIRVTELLNAFPWQEKLPQLVLHANWKINRLRWRNSRNGTPPEGIQAADIVQEVLAKTFDNTRKWDPSRHSDLFLWLKDQIDSEISNLVGSKQNRMQISESTLIDPSILEGIDASSPESILLRNEEESESDSFFLELLDFLENEPDLQKIVEAFIEYREEVDKRSEFARYLCISSTELDACRKRLVRRIGEFKKRNSDQTLEIKGRGAL